MGCPLPDSLRDADALFAETANAVRAFPVSAPLRRLVRAAQGGPVIELERLSGDWANELNQDWTVTRIRGELHYLQCGNRRGLSRSRLMEAVRTALTPYAPEIQTDVANSGNTLYALFALPAENERAFRDFLTSRVGRPLTE